MDLPAPGVPEAELSSAGYERSEDDTDTLAELGPARAVGRTLVYERADAFFFASRVAIDPGLPPGGAAMLGSTVFAAAARSFRDEIRERGASDLDEAGTERLRVRTGERARMRRYAAEIEGKRIRAAVCSWPREDEFRVAGGAGPEVPIELVRDVD